LAVVCNTSLGGLILHRHAYTLFVGGQPVQGCYARSILGNQFMSVMRLRKLDFGSGLRFRIGSRAGFSASLKHSAFHMHLVASALESSAYLPQKQTTKVHLPLPRSHPTC
jgi:hypothetical protein